MITLATVHKDSLTRMYCGELKNEEGETKEVKIAKAYSEILTWAKEHHTRVIDLDIAEMLEGYL